MLRIDTESDESLLDILRKVLAKAGLPPRPELYDFRPYNSDEDLSEPEPWDHDLPRVYQSV